MIFFTRFVARSHDKLNASLAASGSYISLGCLQSTMSSGTSIPYSGARFKPCYTSIEGFGDAPRRFGLHGRPFERCRVGWHWNTRPSRSGTGGWDRGDGMKDLGGFPERFASAFEFSGSRLDSTLSLLVFRDFLLLLTGSQDSLATCLDSVELLNDILTGLNRQFSTRK